MYGCDLEPHDIHKPYYLQAVPWNNIISANLIRYKLCLGTNISKFRDFHAWPTEL
jgi:hypothetical protein